MILAILAAAGGGGYYWYVQKQRKRETAQRLAQKKVAQQNRAAAGKDGTKPAGPASAQNASRVRTGTYTDSEGSAKPKATPSTPTGGPTAGKPYSSGSKNPYGRYSTSDTDEDASYTASFKPGAGERKPRRADSDPDKKTPPRT